MDAIKDYLLAETDHYQGQADERFIDLAMQFSRMQYARVNQGGAALVVYFQGHKVVDIYTGKKSQHEDWQANTLSMCYSTGKGVLSTLAHILVSEGFINYDVSIAHYWPEFAQNAKEQMTLRHILSHQSGLYDIRNLLDHAAEMADWQHMLNVVAQAKPRFELATKAAYQPLTFGWLVGGVLEKATGKSLAELMQQYLVQPLQLDGAYFGVPEFELTRIARPLPKLKKIHVQTSPAKPKLAKTSPLNKLIEWSGQNPKDFQDAMIPKGMKNFSFFSDAALQASIPAANGVFTANSLAKMYAMLANKGRYGNQQLIRPEIFENLSTVQYTKRDRIMPLPMHWRLGYHRVLTLGKSSTGFGHMGFNGSAAWCDPARHLSFAYTHNFPTTSIAGDYRLWALSQETLRCADVALNGRKGWF